MKAKFHAGDIVKVKNIYNTPVPDDLKDDPLLKLFGLNNFNPRHLTEGDEFKIKEVLEPRKRSDGKTVTAYSYFGINGKRSGYILWEDEIELVSAAKPTPTKVTGTVTMEITIDLSNKAEAHRVAHTAVENAFKVAAQPAKQEAAKPKEKNVEDWTPVEIEFARKKVVELVAKVFKDGGDVTFSNDDDAIMCSVYPDSTDAFSRHRGYSRPFEHDHYNVWIGKCVAICKALNEPVPDFIRRKNTNGESA